MELEQYKEDLRQKLEKGFLYSMNDLLLSLDVNSLIFNELNVLKQRYLSNEKNFVRNIILSESYQIEHNKILVAYLNLLKGVEENDLNVQAKKQTPGFRSLVLQKIHPLEKMNVVKSAEGTLLFLAAGFLLTLLAIFVFIRGWNIYLIEYAEVESWFTSGMRTMEVVVTLLVALLMILLVIIPTIVLPIGLGYFAIKGIFKPFLDGKKKYLLPQSRIIKVSFSGDRRLVFQKMLDVFLGFNIEITEMNFDEGLIEGVVTDRSDFSLSRQVSFETGELEIEGKYHLTGMLDLNEEKAEYESTIVITNHRGLVKSKYHIVTKLIDFFSIQLYQLNTIAETIRSTFISLSSDQGGDLGAKTERPAGES